MDRPAKHPCSAVVKAKLPSARIIRLLADAGADTASPVCITDEAGKVFFHDKALAFATDSILRNSKVLKGNRPRQQRMNYSTQPGGFAPGAPAAGGSPCRLLAVDKRRPLCRLRGCRGYNLEPDDSAGGFDAPDLEAEDWKTQGALGRHVQAFEEAFS